MYIYKTQSYFIADITEHVNEKLLLLDLLCRVLLSCRWQIWMSY